MAVPAKIFVIGDTEKGLTIVITDPVMVVHYSEADLRAEGLGNKGRAAIVRHLLPQLRGVDISDLVDYNSDIERNGHGSVEREVEANFFREIHFADTVAQHIASGSGVYDVDFCVAIHQDDVCDLVARGRSVGTLGEQIGTYLDKNSGCTTPKPATVSSSPQKYAIGDISEENLDKSDHWTKP
ncbi:hypothetical protein NBRC116594_10040 [Shimia sp. NS0008-38b]|uniref:hypothetical protein n=1 Tax=Shimia sp. NS0008-38b TaxID=3127653 RepID=UPI003104CF3F